MAGYNTDSQIQGHNEEKVPDLFPSQEDNLEVLKSDPVILDVQNVETILREHEDDRVTRFAAMYENGEPEQVTWYACVSSTAVGRTRLNAIDLESDKTNISLRKYVNLPLWIDGDLTSQYDESNMTETLTGSAISFPGFVPQLGDLFYYSYANERVGVFKVSTVPERTSFEKETTFAFDIVLAYSFTSAINAKLETRTSDTLYFNEKGYKENKAFLTTKQNLLDTRWLERQLSRLEVLYTKFFDLTLNTLRLPGKPYDPFVNEFYRTCLSAYVDRKYIKIPHRDEILDNWEMTIYASFLSEAWLDTPYTKARTFVINYAMDSALITALNGQSVIDVCQDGEEPYPLFNHVNISSPTSDLDTLCVEYIRNRIIDMAALKNHIEAAFTAEDEFQFYIIPLLSFLGKRAVEYISKGENYKLTIPRDVTTFRVGFTANDLTDGTLTVPYGIDNVLLLQSNTGEEYAIDDADKVESDGATLIDIDALKTENNISTLSGTWYIMLTSPIEKVFNYEDL